MSSQLKPAPIPLDNLTRCPWCPVDDAVYMAYHDEEWGVPEHDGQALFAKLILDGAQAGLSWRTILYKREGYYRVFDGLDPARLAEWGPDQMAAALLDPGIVRNRLKVAATVRNARALRAHFGEDLGAFSAFLWDFVGGQALVREGMPRVLADYPATSAESDAMCKALRKMNFTFVGSTICYAFMQAVGMVNDHAVTCFRRGEV